MRSETVWESVTRGIELAMFEGHDGAVNALCTVEAEGRTLLVSAGADGTLRTWDPARPAEPQAGGVLHGHSMAIDSVFAVDHLLISAARGATVRTWDARTGEPLRELTGHRGAKPVVVAGETLIASTVRDAIRLWDPHTGDTRHLLSGTAGAARAGTFAVACIGDVAMARTGDGGIGFWNLTTGERTCLPGPDRHTTTDLGVITVDDRPFFVSAGLDEELEGGRIRLWDPATFDVVRVIEHEPLVERTVDRIKEGRTLLLGGHERLVSIGSKTVRIFDQRTGAMLHAFIPPRSWVEQACFFHADGRELLAVAESYENALCVWDLATGELVNRLEDFSGPTAAMTTVRVDGRTLIATADGHLRTVRLWDPLGPAAKPRSAQGHSGKIRGVWAAKGKLVSVAEESLRIWDPPTGEVLRRIRGQMFGIEDVHAFAVDGRELLAGAFQEYEDGRVKIWDPVAGRQLKRLRRQWDEGPSIVCSFERDGRVLLATAQDYLIRIWDPATGSLVADEEFKPELSWIGRITVDGRPALVGSDRGQSRRGVRLWYPVESRWQHLGGRNAEFAFMLNGRPRVAMALAPVAPSSPGWSLRIWNPLTGEDECVLQGDKGTLFEGVEVLDPDGDPLLVTHGGTDRTVRVWDPASGRCEHAIAMHDEVVRCAALPGDLIATALPSGLLAHRVSR